MCLAVALMALLSVLPGASAQSQSDRLTSFLRSYVGASGETTKTTEYRAAFADLRDDGKSEAIVYLTSGGWCGTGGCTLLILQPQGETFKLVTKIPAVRLPVWVLATKSNGWRDLCLLVRNTGTESVFYKTLPFDGTSYPNSTSAPAVHRSDKRIERAVAIPAGAKSVRLY
jgi:hypothetical protein